MQGGAVSESNHMRHRLHREFRNEKGSQERGCRDALARADSRPVPRHGTAILYAGGQVQALMPHLLRTVPPLEELGGGVVRMEGCHAHALGEPAPGRVFGQGVLRRILESRIYIFKFYLFNFLSCNYRKYLSRAVIKRKVLLNSRPNVYHNY